MKIISSKNFNWGRFEFIFDFFEAQASIVSVIPPNDGTQRLSSWIAYNDPARSSKFNQQTQDSHQKVQESRKVFGKSKDRTLDLVGIFKMLSLVLSENFQVWRVCMCRWFKFLLFQWRAQYWSLYTLKNKNETSSSETCISQCCRLWKFYLVFSREMLR